MIRSEKKLLDLSASWVDFYTLMYLRQTHLHQSRNEPWMQSWRGEIKWPASGTVYRADWVLPTFPLPSSVMNYNLYSLEKNMRYKPQECTMWGEQHGKGTKSPPKRSSWD